MKPVKQQWTESRNTLNHPDITMQERVDAILNLLLHPVVMPFALAFWAANAILFYLLVF